MQNYVHRSTSKVRRILEHNGAARALLHGFVENSLERMPKKCGTMLDGSREKQLVIPETYKYVDILDEINSTLDQLGYEKKISKPSFGRIWNKEYP